MRSGDVIDAQPVNPKNKEQIAMIARKNSYETRWEGLGLSDGLAGGMVELEHRKGLDA